MNTRLQSILTDGARSLFDEINDRLPAGTKVHLAITLQNEFGMMCEPQMFSTVTLKREGAPQT